jgi:hypothetical protein
MKTTREIEVRHPYVGEVPPELLVGFEAFKIDPEWQWIAVADGKVVAQMLCANAHGVLMILRLTSLPDAPHGWAVALFRHVLSDCRELGMLGYMTFLSDDRRAERRLMTIVSRAGGYLKSCTGAWAVGRLDVGY